MRVLSCFRFLSVLILLSAFCLPAAARTDCHADSRQVVIKAQSCKKDGNSTQQIPIEEREKEGREKESENKTKNKEDLLNLLIAQTLFTDKVNDLLSASCFIDGCNPYLFPSGKPLYISTRNIRV